MNIHRISAWQKGNFNTIGNKWEGVNCFKDYACICMGRRTYKRNKSITRSLDHMSNVEGKSRAYKAKISDKAWRKAAGDR